MRKIIFAITALFALGSFLTASAGPAFKIKDVSEFTYLQPCGCIDLFHTDGGYYSQYHTDKATQIVADIIDAERFPFSDMIPADYYDDGANASIPYYNEMLCAVIDKEERSVVYFKKQDAPLFSSHPTDYEDVSKMLHKLLKGFIR